MQKYEKYQKHKKILKIQAGVGGLGKPPRHPIYPIPDPTPNSVQFQTLALSLYYLCDIVEYITVDIIVNFSATAAHDLY